ncbi:MAG: chromate efflux transporter [Acidimicrobiia bacterium]|nr:chromate efflux transporter [Acidimicrobiia bacterium]NNF11454.1 chromate efflux transporter [Acidimicrobiia bacterium]
MTETTVTSGRIDGEDVRAWSTVAANSFGGPAGQIAAMHDEIVERRGWVAESSFLHALNYCMLLPGPEAQQLATYLGWLTRGIKGGLLAGGLFILPGFVSILVLSVLDAGWGDVAWVEGIFRGVGPAVVAIVAQAVLRIGRRTVKKSTMLSIAAASFVAIFFYELPFPLIVLSAGLVGLAGAHYRPDVFVTVSAHDAPDGVVAPPPRWSQTALVIIAGLALWLGPVLIIGAVTGWGSVWSDIGVFFSQAAVVTFGGAYSVLAYMAQQAVEVYGWLEPGEMVDGLGLAETTPGPLIQVTQFVGFLGAHRSPGTLSPLVAGTLGAVLTTWVTFVPSFLWILAGAPHVERLKNRPTLSGALSTITAAVVGVVLNLGVWFGVYTLFGEVVEREWLGARLLSPTLATVDWLGVAIAVGAVWALFRARWRILPVVVSAAAIGLLAGVL